MQYRRWPWVLAIAVGSIIPQASVALAARITYNVEYFLENSFDSNISVPKGSKVGSATFSYDPSNLINFGSLFDGKPIYVSAPGQNVDPTDPNVPDFLKGGPPSTLYGQPYTVVDQFSGTLLGANWTLADRTPSYFLVGTQNLANGNVSTFDSSYKSPTLIPDDPTSFTPSYTQFDYRFDANGWHFTPLRNPDNPREFVSDPRRIDMVSLGGCAAPLTGCRDPFSVKGQWFSLVESPDGPLGSGSVNGFFTTSLKTSFPEVPESSTEMPEVFGGLVLLFGTLCSKWRKKLHA
jgi:hypothetical protein